MNKMIFPTDQQAKLSPTAVCCPQCGDERVVKRGWTANGKQRYLCRQSACSTKTFILDYDHQGSIPEIRKKIVDMAMSGSGVCHTARVLAISPTTVIKVLKKTHSNFRRHSI